MKRREFAVSTAPMSTRARCRFLGQINGEQYEVRVIASRDGLRVILPDGNVCDLPVSVNLIIRVRERGR